MSDHDHLAADRHESGEPPLPPSLSVIVPFFNEIQRLEGTLDEIVGLSRCDVEVILVDDGSSDGTARRLSDVASSSPGVVFVGLPENRGKGAAVRAGVARARGDRVLFMDADLATDLAALPQIVEALATSDVVIGSRSSAHAEITDATALRSWMGATFNRAVRLLTGLQFQDTQCGFKALRGEPARVLFAHGRVDGFAFDVELLMLARAGGLSIAELPVSWKEVGGSKVRLGVDPIRMLYDVIRCRWYVRRVARHLRAELGHDGRFMQSSEGSATR